MSFYAESYSQPGIFEGVRAQRDIITPNRPFLLGNQNVQNSIGCDLWAY